jgi:hypothetical protein
MALVWIIVRQQINKCYDPWQIKIFPRVLYDMPRLVLSKKYWNAQSNAKCLIIMFENHV